MTSPIPLILGFDSDSNPSKLVESNEISVNCVCATTIELGGTDILTLINTTTIETSQNVLDEVEFRFGTDSDTVIYHTGTTTVFDMQAANEIGFVNGQVGFGTTGPGQAVDIVGETAGAAVSMRVDHTDNTNVGSDARIIVRTGGTGGGDPHLRCLISGGQSICLGIANGASDEFRICDAADLDSGVIFGADTSQNTYIPQTLSIGDSNVAAGGAILEVDSTTGGILFPRMTTTQRDLIVGPADGLVIWNTTTGQLEVYDSGWVAV